MHLIDYCCMYSLPDYLSLLENKIFSCIKNAVLHCKAAFFEVGQKVCVLIRNTVVFFIIINNVISEQFNLTGKSDTFFGKYRKNPHGCT